MLFAAATAEFLIRRRIYIRDPRTLKSQFRVLGLAFGPIVLSSIDSSMIEAWMARRLDQGTSRSTLNRNRAALSVLFEWAIAEGLRPGPNPVRSIPPFREGPGRTRYLTPDEAQRLWLAAAAHLKPIIQIALHTGGRLSEILALRWGDLDLDGRLVTYRREVTKGGKTRHVPINDSLAASLAALRRGRPDQFLCHWGEEPIRSVKTAFSTARRKAGLGPDVTFHTLRHTFASWAIQNGLDLGRLQKYLGHSDVSLTQRYSHLSREFLADGARFIGPPARAKAPESEQT